MYSHSVCLNLALLMVLSFTSGPASAAISSSEIQTLEEDYRSISNKLYLSLAKNLNQCKTRARSLKSLNAQLQNLSKNVIGICLIQNNISLIEKNIDSNEVFPIIQFLLNSNNIFLADKLYQSAKEEGENSLVSNIKFIYAKYYLKRKQWEKVLEYIKGTYNDLTIENANLARLYTGIALQKIKKHRPAIKIYSTIDESSKYYPAARLNIATAYIKQDWWTDAHIEINNILNSKKIKVHSEMVNRLYLVLGYSLLHKEFYRDSREAFRNIEIDSIYFNKALLGISLTATNQEDFIGALNAINILKEKKGFDLSIDESHLLLPYIYEKLEQNLTASASYTDAQSYYQERIKNINLIKNRNNINPKNIINNNGQLKVGNNIVDFNESFPESFLDNSMRLDEISLYYSHIKDKNLLIKLDTLKEKYSSTLSKIITVIFDNRLTHLNSYMNQARFGLARLFDNSNITKK